MTQRTRSDEQKITIFRQCFSGLAHAYGTYDPSTGCVRQVKQPVTDAVILNHLRGRQPYGVYLLVDDRTRAVVADFDDDDPMPPRECLEQARHYHVPAYIERSKCKGYHVWVFADQAGVLAASARAVMRLILDEIGRSTTELFPKHDRLDPGTRYGNFINAPLFGKLVAQGHSVFVDPLHNMNPYPDQWDVLAGVERVCQRQLDDIIEINDLAQLAQDGPHAPSPDQRPASHRYGLPKCAVRMLSDGVSANQRVSCFRLAVHFKRLGLPQDIAVAALRAWSAKNRPHDRGGIITEAEIIAQTQCAFGNHYRSYGCEDAIIGAYCDPNCPLQKQRQQSAHSAD